jgi:phospholipase C
MVKKEILHLKTFIQKVKKIIPLQKSEEKIVINLASYKGWYDLKITSEEHSWHFAGRIETGKVSVSDPHWA